MVSELKASGLSLTGYSFRPEEGDGQGGRPVCGGGEGRLLQKVLEKWLPSSGRVQGPQALG